MKGIILAGGSGTRLYPITKAVSKQLLPIYDKPMIYYPLSVLKLAGIREVLLITTPTDLINFKRLLGGGAQFGLDIEYAIQEEPKGIAQALTIGKEFIEDDACCLILGDNIFYGQKFTELLLRAKYYAYHKDIATVFGYPVKDPQRFGVAELKEGKLVGIEEKPEKPKSNYAITGLYMYPAGVSNEAISLEPSARGELEITDLNAKYLKYNKLRIELLGKGFIWFDTGTPRALLQASNLVQAIQDNQGIKIADLENMDE